MYFQGMAQDIISMFNVALIVPTSTCIALRIYVSYLTIYSPYPTILPPHSLINFVIIIIADFMQ